VAVDPILLPLLAWLATAAIHGTVLVLSAWALGATLGRFVEDRVALAAVRERLWKLAIFGGIVTGSLAFAQGRTWKLDLAPSAPPAPPPMRVVPESAFPATQSPAGAIRAAPASRRISFSWVEAAALLWLAGIAINAGLWLRDQRRLAARLRGRTPVTWGLAHEKLRAIAALSGRADRVRLSFAPGLTAPITRGIFRPEICLPPRAERELLPEELDAMLAHELAHARRRDPLLLALCRTIEVFFPVQPLSRFARRRLLEEIEILCDDHAALWTGDPASLASCLAEVATWIVSDSPEARAIAMASRRSRLEQRVHELIYRRRSAAPRERRWVVTAALLALSATTLPLPAIAMRSRQPIRIEPPTGPATALATAAAEPEPVSFVFSMRDAMDSLDEEYAELAAHPGLAKAPQELRDRLEGIRARLETVRAMESELERMLAEEVSAERPGEP
jgi:beta-lactamase regulating signal transducer with metallopeptidase domain